MKNLQNAGKEWSSADLKKLEKLADGNTPTGLIAYQLKRSEAAVYSKASEEKISLHPTNQSPQRLVPPRDFFPTTSLPGLCASQHVA